MRRFFGKSVLVIAVAFTLIIAIPSLMGYTLYEYTSSLSSMEPKDVNIAHGSGFSGGISQGSLLMVERVDPSTIEPGDAVVYDGYYNGYDGPLMVVMFECQSNDLAAQQLITGRSSSSEANLTPVPYSAVIGRVAHSIPFIGDCISKMAAPPGIAILIGMYVIGVLLYAWATRAKRRRATPEDWRNLSEALDEANKYDERSLLDYTFESVFSFKNAREHASHVLGDSACNGPQVREATKDLREAMQGLKPDESA